MLDVVGLLGEAEHSHAVGVFTVPHAFRRGVINDRRNALQHSPCRLRFRGPDRQQEFQDLSCADPINGRLADCWERVQFERLNPLLSDGLPCRAKLRRAEITGTNAHRL